MIPENGYAKFNKFYPGGFTEYMHTQFQNSQEFALDGGVILTYWPIATSLMQIGCSFQHFSVQNEFGF